MSSVCLTNHWPYKADLACKLLKSVKSVFRFLIRVNRERGVLRFGTALFFLCSQKSKLKCRTKNFGIMAGLFIIIVATVAVADMFCDYLKMDDENIAL